MSKRRDYAALDIPEYWRFDEAGRRAESRLAGDRLVWHDPATGQHILTYDDQRTRAEARIRELEEENRRLRGA